MTTAFGYLDTREKGKRNYQLLKDFWCIDPVYGKITAKKSFITNYASIDILLKLMMFAFYALLAGYGDKAATIHDWLYSGYGIETPEGNIYYPSRLECDEIFYRALKSEGVDRVRSLIFYWGVRVGGKSSYTSGKQQFVPEDILEA